MSDVTIVLTLVVVVLGLFVWNRFPPVAVAVGAALALFYLGIIDGNQAVSGFGIPVVIFIASLFVISTGLELTGVTAWAGQWLIARAGDNTNRLYFFLLVLVTILTAVVSLNGAVAAVMPIAIIVAVRTGMPVSHLLIPIAFAGHAATMLTLLGSNPNVLVNIAAQDAQIRPFRFFEYAWLGVPMVIGTVLILMTVGRRLLPVRESSALPADFSEHARTLVEQYRLDDGLVLLRVRSTSPYIGKPRAEVDLKDYAGLTLVAIQDGETAQPLTRATLAEGDMLLVRGDAQAAGRLATDRHLAFRSEDGPDGVAETLFNRGSGLAEVVIPPRSKLIGQTVFPGMTVRDGDLMVLAVQRAGENMEAEPTALAAGDHLLLQGTWQALDKRLPDPQVLVVDSPELLRRQAVPLGLGAKEAIGIVVVLVGLLAFDLVPPAVAGVSCALAMVLLGIVTLPQAYRGIDWNTCLLIGGMVPLATAMTQSGAADLIGDQMVVLLGDAGPVALLAGLFFITACITQLIANASAALIVFPIALAVAAEVGVNPQPLLMGVLVGAHAAFMTPVATPPNLMIYGPGGYKFGDYWKLGLLCVIWFGVVVVVGAPLVWRF
ncbi:MAG: SLC13 family permease [Xanthobacteraceae bacterium]|nr:SLC13 family permease [Xanthobacteraceae bacterium]